MIEAGSVEINQVCSDRNSISDQYKQLVVVTLSMEPAPHSHTYICNYKILLCILAHQGLLNNVMGGETVSPKILFKLKSLPDTCIQGSKFFLGDWKCMHSRPLELSSIHIWSKRIAVKQCRELPNGFSSLTSCPGRSSTPDFGARMTLHLVTILT